MAVCLMRAVCSAAAGRLRLEMQQNGMFLMVKYMHRAGKIHG